MMARLRRAAGRVADGWDDYIINLQPAHLLALPLLVVLTPVVFVKALIFERHYEN